MKNFYLLFVTLATILTFNACSESIFETVDGTYKVQVTACETYTVIDPNDVLVEDDNNTVVKIVHDANDTKTICVVSGSAYLIKDGN